LDVHQRQIKISYLPSDSPELNSNERLNGDLKQVIETRAPFRKSDKLRQAATRHLAATEKNSGRIKSFFRDPILAYAA
jgi:hypothetical protein